jgi:hypothetical protein
MERDVKEVVGLLMRVIGGAEPTQDEVTNLAFDASGELETAVNEAYIQLLEFAHDRGLRGTDPERDRQMRSELEHSLQKIARLADVTKAAFR